MNVPLEALESQLEVLYRIQEERAGEHIALCKECFLLASEHSLDPTHPVAHFLPIEYLIARIQNEIDCKQLLANH